MKVKDIKKNILELLDAAKFDIVKDYYEPENDEEQKDVLNFIAFDLQTVSAIRLALYHDRTLLEELLTSWSEKKGEWQDNMFEICNEIEDKWEGKYKVKK